ncbi:MAG TPA: hypothetical protein VFZ17_06100 [Acidimicrobiia bacterium]|nr:hypothetical protein [Acidimicrobiia bacterium]
MDDARFGRPFIDIDEWRETPRRIRYVHGGFEDTHTLFSFYFPPPEDYQGRFFQFLEGGAGGHENLLAAGWQPGINLDWVFDLVMDELGGYVVESNQGHYPGEGTGFGNDIELWGASAQAALYGKELAAEMYGDAPHHGYIWGVSGGGARSGHCLENRPDVWQGGSPHAGMGQSTQWSPWALTWLLAKDKFTDIVDAVEPGGSGNPFDGLDNGQREALAELYRRGYPRGGESQLGPFTAWAFSMYGLLVSDPQYMHDFWNTPGYIGHDEPEVIGKLVLHEKATIKEVFPASESTSVFAQMATRLGTAGAATTDPTWAVRLDIDPPDPDLLFMAQVTILTGKAAGRELVICELDDGVISPFSEMTPDVFEDVEPGDEVLVDNRAFVAWAYYHRYTLTNHARQDGGIITELEPWTVDGHAVYPQQPRGEPGPSTPGGYKARVAGKMIYVQPTLDNMVWPTTIWPYDRMLRENLGSETDDHYRLWFVENACHGAPDSIGPMISSTERDPAVWRSRLVSYDGATSQALRDVVAWVEDDVAPPFYRGYELTRDNRLVLPPTAAERGGIQPLVTSAANGGIRAEVVVGEPVTFTGRGEQPPGMGTIVGAEWDFEGRDEWTPSAITVDGTSASVEVSDSHTYTEPGTYFPSFRVGAHRLGAAGTGLPVQNLARARVVVRPAGG